MGKPVYPASGLDHGTLRADWSRNLVKSGLPPGAVLRRLETVAGERRFFSRYLADIGSEYHDNAGLARTRTF